MKRLLILVLVVAAIWSGWWLAGAGGMKTAYRSWFEARQAEGWQAEYADLSLRGFPNRFDLTLEAPQLADPETGWAWQAPFFQLFALAYRPNHVIAVWPKEQTLANPQETITVRTEDMRASLVVNPSPDLPIARSNLVIEGLNMTSDLDWSISADKMQLALREREITPNRYQIALIAEGLTPPAALREAAQTGLPAAFETLESDLDVSFDRPWDRFALERARPQPRSIRITTMKAQWGAMLFQMKGDLTVDEVGVPEGELAIQARNWRDMIALARSSAEVSPAALDFLESALGLVAQMSGNENNLDLTLAFKGGATYLGPLPIGPAPRLQLR